VPDSALILLVEDREDDILVMQRAFEKAHLTNPVQVVNTGEEAVAYLNGVGKYTNRAEYPLPALILLDLKLPGMDGFELLSWIRRQEGIQAMPVIVLTSSDQIRDVNRAYAMGANSFFVKEMDFREAISFANLLREYWLKKALKPNTTRPARKPKQPD
jgi:CheY-like chemotaxis protein